jgi:hypothetical protein
MIRFLQLILFLSCSILFSASFAQSERGKIVKADLKNDVQLTTPVNTVSVNVSEEKESSENRQIPKTNTMQLKLADSLLVRKRKTGLQDDNTINNAQKVFLSDNVTYIKEDLPDYEKTVSSEKTIIKPTPSVNFTPRVIKEDIHPALNYSSTDISSDKRVYLQQEADDLIREMDLNAGNVNYDFAYKKKKLDEIKKMLQ